MSKEKRRTIFIVLVFVGAAMVFVRGAMGDTRSYSGPMNMALNRKAGPRSNIISLPKAGKRILPAQVTNISSNLNTA